MKAYFQDLSHLKIGFSFNQKPIAMRIAPCVQTTFSKLSEQRVIDVKRHNKYQCLSQDGETLYMGNTSTSISLNMSFDTQRAEGIKNLGGKPKFIFTSAWKSETKHIKDKKIKSKLDYVKYMLGDKIAIIEFRGDPGHACVIKRDEEGNIIIHDPNPIAKKPRSLADDILYQRRGYKRGLNYNDDSIYILTFN